MLINAILIIAIISGQKTTIDYEIYNDIHYCEALATEINAHYAQRDNAEEYEMECVCIPLDKISEDV